MRLLLLRRFADRERRVRFDRERRGRDLCGRRLRLRDFDRDLRRGIYYK